MPSNAPIRSQSMPADTRGDPPVNGAVRPDLSHPGLGLELKRADAAQYAVRF